MKSKPRIVITAGDPRGIGPEVTKKALKDPGISGLADFSVITACDDTGFEAIERAVVILKKGGADGLVTAPVNKAAISRSGISFKGHTEYLAKATRAKSFVMMFCGGPLKVTVITRHIALKDVPKALTRKGIRDGIVLTEMCLRRHFGIVRPRIGVCGLNPHCGEDGLFGTEEKRLILPVIKTLSRDNPGICGPLPADAVFYMAYNGKLDAVVAMYHDQGLAPFKMVAFQSGVNVTLGLPFMRTSPDHGTAYDIAGKDIADPGSMKEAIKTAVAMCRGGFL